MNTAVDITINAPKEKVWQVITDIKNSANTITGIEKIEIIENPTNSLVGFKWKETRTVFGKTSTETMWITEAEENVYYKTRAESHGAIYRTILKITEQGNASVLMMEFSSEAVSFKGKLLDAIFNGMLKKSMKKLLYKDLEDIKKVVEAKNL
tara:strand:+ start:644 stop:1099 length:456 start_codon:yes stop_codon:yes gene_type:complete